MIFDASSVCQCLYCREETAHNSVLLQSAPLCVVLVSSGTARCCGAEHTASGKAFVRAKAGSVVLAAGGMEVHPLEGCHFIAAGLAGTAAQSAAQNIGALLLSDGGACPQAPQLLASLLHVPLHHASAAHEAYALLCALCAADEAVPAVQPLVSLAIAAMRKSFAGIYGVEELSAQLGVSKSHLVRVFSAEMGVPPGQYLTQVRVAEAKRLLATRSYPLELVATLCGFSGANYLCKVFKKYTGQTCAAYRAAAKQPFSKNALTEQENSLYI